MSVKAGGSLGLVLALVAVMATGAEAAERLYVANEAGSGNPLVSRVDLAGGGSDLVPATGGDFADGVAIDAAAGRLYYGRNSGASDRISFVDLDGTGGGDLPTPGVTVDFPNGLAIDPAAGLLYWANYGANEIAFARLDGSDAGTIDTTGATVSSPIGVAIDPAGGRIYWANNGATAAISFANLDGSGGGGDLNTTGASTNSAWGVALDLAGGKAYWGNGDKISFAALDGSGGGDLDTTGASVVSAGGIAIDVPAGRLYWANTSADSLSFAALDGSGGGDLDSDGASLGNPSLPALLARPAGAGAPQITAAPGGRLSCTRGTWAPDLLGAMLYRAPKGFSFQWSRNGTPIAGATASTFDPAKPGTYRCSVTAGNAAGSAAQTSAARVVASEPPDAEITKAKIKRREGKAKFKFEAVGDATGFQCRLKRKRHHGRFRDCSSPKRYKHLKKGRYVFKVRAVGPGGKDPTAAKKRFRIR